VLTGNGPKSAGDQDNEEEMDHQSLSDNMPVTESIEHSGDFDDETPPPQRK